MKDIFFFDSMLTPKIITFVYWLLLLGSVVSGVTTMFGVRREFCIRPIYYRVWLYWRKNLVRTAYRTFKIQQPSENCYQRIVPYQG